MVFNVYMDNKSKNIILIGPTPPPYTGQSLSFEMLINGCKEIGLRPLVVDIARKTNKDSRYAWIFRVFELLSAYKNLVKYLFKYSRSNVYITIAQSRQGFIRDFLYIWTCTLFKVNITAHLKGGNYDGFYSSQGYLLRFLIRLTLRSAKKILVLGESLKEMYDFEPSLKNKISVVHNGLPISKRGSSKSITPSGSVRILFLSNLIESKGYEDVVRALAILRDRYKINASAVFAGEFMVSEDDKIKSSILQKKNNFNSLVSKLNLKNRVEFLGSVDGDLKWQLFSRAHFFCLPTKYINEGQPVSIIEAMAYGCVILATKFRAITDLIEDDVSGKFIRYLDPESIAAAVNDILLNHQYNKMSMEAIRIFDEKFTREIHLKNILHEIMNQ